MPTPTLTIEQHDREVIDNINEQDQEILDTYSSLFIPSDHDAFIELSGIKPDGGKYTMTYPHKISPYLLLCHLQLLDDGKGNNISNLNARAYTCQIPVNNKKTGKFEPRGFYYPPKDYEVFKAGAQLSDKQGMTKAVMFDFDAHRLYELAKVRLPFPYTERELIALLKDVPEDQQKAKRYELIEQRKLEILKAREAAQNQIQPYLDADASKLCELLEKDGLIPYIEPSTRGGLHVWVLFDEAVSVAKLKAYSDQLAKSLEGQLNQFFETYPKSGSEHSNRAFLPLEFITRDGVILHLNDLDDLQEIDLSKPDVIQAVSVKAKKTKAKKSDSKDTKKGSVTLSNNPDLLDAEQMFETLKACALNAPDSFERHHAIPAFLNLAERIGKKEDMLEFLQGEAIHKAWGLAQDASRSLNQWADEVEAWAEQDPPVNESGEVMQRGVPYLINQGFDLSEFGPQLKELEQDQRQVVVNNRHHNEVADELVSKMLGLTTNNQPVVYERAQGLIAEMVEGFKLSAELSQPPKLKAFLHDQFLPVTEKTAIDKETNEPYTFYVPSSFNDNQVQLILRKTQSFPKIETVSDIPLLLSDGSLLLEPGYHPEHGYFLNTEGIVISPMEVDKARELFLTTFNEFSYQSPRAGFTATLAFILQPFVMPVIDGLTPIYGFFGSKRAGSGTGKGYAVDCGYRIHKGRPYSHDGSMPSTDEEMGKVLFSALSEGVSHIIFDDIEHLKHRQLMAAVTSRNFTGRILGVSKRHEVSTQVTWVVTGNAPDIHRDFYRRLIPIYMGVGKAKAWEREYSVSDLSDRILQDRNLYLSAIVSILRYWVQLGMPLSEKTIKGFDRWSAVIGGILESIGFPHLTEARDGLDELIEVDTSDLDLLIAAWRSSSFHDHKVKCSVLLNFAKERELFSEFWEGRSDAAAAGELGKYLKPFANDVFEDVYLRREFDTDKKTWRYFLEAVPEEPKLLSDVFQLKPLAQQTTPIHPRSTPVTPLNQSTTGVLRGSSEVVQPSKEEKLTFLPIQADEPLSFEQLEKKAKQVAREVLG